MPLKLPYLPETSSQTAGPFVHIGLAPQAAGIDGFRQLGTDIAGDAPGPRIRVEGMVIDGTGTPLRDALVEVWQADANGIHPHPEDPRAAGAALGFRGWGRIVPDFETGLWTFATVKPGPVPGRSGRTQAPHLTLWIVARGINIGLNTRLYFPEDAALHAGDPVLTLIEQPARRATLIATATGPDSYRFDIRLQGDGETVFLDI